MQNLLDKKFALLIDSENISPKYITAILDELSKYGIVTYKRLYGNWTSKGAESWKSILLAHALTPVQQFNYTTGKNSTDSSMIIDAMDILYSGNVDGFCIASSDSDFTKLCTRLRESGKYVIGMGEKKAPKSFTATCDKFVYLDVLKEDSISHEQTSLTKEVVTSTLLNIIPELDEDKDGWVSLSDVFNILSKRLPDYDSRVFGHSKTSNFVKTLDGFEIDAREGAGDKKCINYYIRVKKVKPARTPRKRATSTKKVATKKK
ncbi:MAG: NYN domain-containing protein [Clostridia bacterium]|nr:NYN domain-containing protein [Clostridia bacterium]